MVCAARVRGSGRRQRRAAGVGPEPDVGNTLEYIPAAGTWRCSWMDPASGLMQTLDRRVPRARQTGGVLRPIAATEYLAAKATVRRLLLEDARGRVRDVNALRRLELGPAALALYCRE